jgi:FkbM family methyltransferase
VQNAYTFVKGLLLAHLPRRWLRPLKEWHYVRVLRTFDERQEPDLVIVRQLVAPGATVLDLGANIGLYTKVLSELVGNAGRVLSIEPMPETFAILSRNVHRLGLRNVTLINAAVSNTGRSVTMEVPRYSSGGGNFYEARIVTMESRSGRSESTQHVQVTARTLDDIVSSADVQDVQFVKCDVEGHELACLAGATSLLERQRPMWLIEVSGDPDVPDANARRVLDAMRPRGYRPWLYNGRQLVERRQGDRSINLFFFTEEHVRHLRERTPSLIGPAHGNGGPE